jgi:hypothetical protein
MVSHTRTLCILILLFLLATPASAYNKTKIIQLFISYDANFQNLELQELKAMYGYASSEELPGNATLYLLSDDQQVLYKLRVAFTEPIFVVNPPLVDIDTNEVVGSQGIEYPEEGMKQINVPYYENATSIKIAFDTNESFIMSIADRLCNNNGICDAEESSISCDDCEPDMPDNVCIAFDDNVCDPDCALGVDIDCVRQQAKPTATPVQSPTETPSEPITISEQEGINIIYAGLAVVVLLLLASAVLYYRKVKGG